MNPEMDLRSPQFIAENRPFRLKMTLLSTLVLVIALPVFTSFLVDHYYERTNLKIAEQKEKLAELEIEALPVNELQLRTACLENQYRLNSRFEKSSTPAADIISLIHTGAETGNLIIKTITICKEGGIVITGATASINSGANFNRALVKHPLIETAAVSSLEKFEEQAYSFVIKGSFVKNVCLEETATSGEYPTGITSASKNTGNHNFEPGGTADD